MKRLTALAMAFLLVVMNCAGALAVNVGDTVTAAEGGATNISFGEGLYGFCLDNHLAVASPGDSFTVVDAAGNAQSNVDERDIANQIKLLFTEYFAYLYATEEGVAYFGDPWHYDGEDLQLWHAGCLYAAMLRFC